MVLIKLLYKEKYEFMMVEILMKRKYNERLID